MLGIDPNFKEEGSKGLTEKVKTKSLRREWGQILQKSWEKGSSRRRNIKDKSLEVRVVDIEEENQEWQCGCSIIRK